MMTHWKLQTHGDPLGALRKFVGEVWQRAWLGSLVVPVRVPQGVGVVPLLLEDPDQLSEADPFAPFMTVSAAPLVAVAARETQRPPLGAVLRPCELRALADRARRENLPLDRVLTIGVDCLGTFPAEDYLWRAQKYGPDEVTRELLRFARQGGILPHRFRPACQMCTAPGTAAADVSIGVVGLPARRAMLISASPDTARRLGLRGITDGEAEAGLLAQHREMRALAARRHERARSRLIDALPASLPASVETLMAHLANCAPCTQCLDVCPTYAGELADRNGGAARGSVSRWLAACVGCGLCEEACPKRLPLSAVMSRLNWEVLGEWITA